jgi:hypothetical protein
LQLSAGQVFDGREFDRQTRRSIRRTMRRVCRSLSNVAVDHSQPVARGMAEATAATGVQLWSQPILEANGRFHLDCRRIFFSLPGKVRDDDQAARVAEGLLLLSEMFHGPMLDLTEAHFAFPFYPAPYKKRRGVPLAALIRDVESLVEDSHPLFTDQMIGSCHTISAGTVGTALRALPTFLGDQQIRMGVAFLAVAQHTFYVWPGQLREAVDDGARMPKLASELAMWESAYQNSYKAVEAIIGDPPRDERKYAARLREAGIDPDEPVGYRVRERVADVIRRMTEIRDKRAAHGSNRLRGIQLHEMVEFQECARYVLNVAINQRMGGTLLQADKDLNG